MTTITFTTRQCFHCKQTTTVELPADSFYQWKTLGAYIQDAFPNMPADQREILISGTHPECWEAMFGGTED